MSLQDDVAQINETLKFLPRQFDELRGDIRRLAEVFKEELEAEKKSEGKTARSSLNWPPAWLCWKEEAAKESQIPGHSLPDRGLLKYLE